MLLCRDSCRETYSFVLASAARCDRNCEHPLSIWSRCQPSEPVHVIRYESTESNVPAEGQRGRHPIDECPSGEQSTMINQPAMCLLPALQHPDVVEALLKHGADACLTRQANAGMEARTAAKICDRLPLKERTTALRSKAHHRRA